MSQATSSARPLGSRARKLDTDHLDGDGGRVVAVRDVGVTEDSPLAVIASHQVATGKESPKAVDYEVIRGVGGDVLRGCDVDERAARHAQLVVSHRPSGHLD